MKTMANSKLVNVTKLSPNCSKPRNMKIDRLTPHHTAGVLSVESALDWFSRTSTQASCNYIVGNDGRIGLCVDEANRAEFLLLFVLIFAAVMVRINFYGFLIKVKLLLIHQKQMK